MNSAIANVLYPVMTRVNKALLVGTLVMLAVLSACTGVNTFPMTARAGDTVSVMVGGTEQARKETISASLKDAYGQTWDLKSLGLVRSVFNLRMDGRASGLHYSSYLDLNISWLLGHEPLQTVMVADIPSGAAPGPAALTISLNTTDNSSGAADPFTVKMDIISGTGRSDTFLRQDGSVNGSPADLSKLEPAPHAKIVFGSGSTSIGAASLVIDFDETVLNSNDINVYVPEATVRDPYATPSAFGETQRMVYWRQDGLRLYVDVVAPQGISSRYLQVFVIHPKGLSRSPNFSLVSTKVYDVNGNAMTLQPVLQYHP
jgi:hypothetical protein